MYVNLTAHPVNVYSADGKKLIKVIPPSGEVARVLTYNVPLVIKEDIPIFSTRYGNIAGLPEEVEGTILVVSTMVRIAVPWRKDLASPGEIIRNQDGLPIGCKGLWVN